MGVLQVVLSSVWTLVTVDFHFVVAIYIRFLMVILCNHSVRWFGNETTGLGMRLFTVLLTGCPPLLCAGPLSQAG